MIGDLKVPLYRSLARHITDTHCPAIDQYAVVLRVDGSLDKFGDEGLARLRFAKAKRYITIDIQIPEGVWQPMSVSQTKNYLAKQVRSAILSCVERLVREKCLVDRALLQAQVDVGINEYLAIENDG